MKSGIADPQGQWFGPWPLQGADDCRTKLFPNGNFEMECRGRDKYAGTGTWLRRQDRIEFDFRLFVRNGQANAEIKKLTLRTSGAMCVGRLEDRGEPYCWKRANL